MQTKVDDNNLLGNTKIFANSGEVLPLPPLSSSLHRASQEIQSLLNSGGEGGLTTDRDLGVSGLSGLPGETISEDYDGQRRNIFSISSGAGARLELSRERPGGGGCVRMMFNEFCETTGLHGWKYLTRVSQITYFSHNTAS